ncbi:PREDICTED: aquaporin AQPAn.G isoform X1 [Eufriesea mexicana]|uniref:aquaporin AQPAn.G isoform X1 n=1 Tax=Eufriesea mexicana TaxID=516756 RepID=UPI00083C3592|nr:PREDICTED: aquaporin AQPAn.G isoform X1 [Eufriesea mexicana]XP_017766077.1 PREDICTED: aquaporin AQPAn.G isoform X1 [Eufriesea mexicana]
MANIKEALGAGELTDKKAGLYRALIAEFLGTLLLNFFGCGAVITGNVVAISLAFGLAVATAIQGIGHVSGGHVNPAVTFGLMIIGKVPIIRGLLYVILQCIGAIAGSGILRALSPERMENALGVVSLSPGVTPVQGFGIEFFLAFVLVLVVCGACDAAKPDSKGIAPLIIGLSVSVGHIVGVPRTGAGMNPARSFGSAVVMGLFDNHWLYWVGPILGGMAAGLIYAFVIGPAKESESSNRPYTAAATDEKELQSLTSKKKDNPA